MHFPFLLLLQYKHFIEGPRLLHSTSKCYALGLTEQRAYKQSADSIPGNT
jgi:hypothetical protein